MDTWLLMVRIDTTRNRPLPRLHAASLALFCLLLPSAAWSWQASPPTGSLAAAPTHGMTAVDLEAFLDGLVPLQIERDDIAGAVIAVVKDGRLLFAKGYGYADVKKQIPVSPASTLFRPASISKLFTWTSVMQLVEQGKLDLDRDVNDYIDFRIPATFGKPVTLRNLMTHTPGFEESVKELFVSDPRDLQPLGIYLAAHLPKQIFAPGTTPAYSNYGAGLAGYIVQRVSGRPFNDYVTESVFKPLGMTRSTFAQPLPEALSPLMSKGYALASGGEKPFEVVQPPPAGSLSTTAADITHFMIAHLQDGQYGDARILRPETARLMHARQFGLDPSLNAMALGFYEQSGNGHRIIGHGGDLQYFHSDLFLVPDANLGFFVSYNSQGRGDSDPRQALWEKVLDRYFPYNPPPASTPPSAVRDARSVTGTYMLSRRAETTVLKLAYLLAQAKVSAKDDGSIEIDPVKSANGQPRRWREVGPLTYRDTEGRYKVIFRRDPAGRLEGLTDIPVFVVQRASFWQDQRLILAALSAIAGVLILTLLLWPVAALVRWHYKRQLSLGAGERQLRLAVRAACAVNLVFLAGWTGFLLYGLEHIALLTSRLDPWLRLLQVVGVIGLVGTLLVAYNGFRTWMVPGRWWWTRLHDTAMALACLGCVWLMWSCNLLHPSLMY